MILIDIIQTIFILTKSILIQIFPNINHVNTNSLLIKINSIESSWYKPQFTNSNPNTHYIHHLPNTKYKLTWSDPSSYTRLILYWRMPTLNLRFSSLKFILENSIIWSMFLRNEEVQLNIRCDYHMWSFEQLNKTMLNA